MDRAKKNAFQNVALNFQTLLVCQSQWRSVKLVTGVDLELCAGTCLCVSALKPQGGLFYG